MKINKFWILKLNKKILLLLKILFMLIIIKSMYLQKLNKKNDNNGKINENLLKKKIKESYELNGHVNINYIESKITNGRFWAKNKDVLNEINIGIQLDPSYVLRGMMTLASIMDSSKPKTKLRFHIAVVLSFSIDNMLKIYSLREKIRNDVEFN